MQVVYFIKNWTVPNPGQGDFPSGQVNINMSTFQVDHQIFGIWKVVLFKTLFFTSDLQDLFNNLSGYSFPGE